MAIEYDEAYVKREEEHAKRQARADIVEFLKGHKLDDTLPFGREHKTPLGVFLNAIAMLHDELLSWAQEEQA
jgi:hypothetical protein